MRYKNEIKDYLTRFFIYLIPLVIMMFLWLFLIKKEGVSYSYLAILSVVSSAIISVCAILLTFLFSKQKK